ncbi:hypothetical protein [Phenylobacterium sp.]|uniref:hypothetical protein n=1 Tax=Phenylobacterium sp. TaxID=1871053 RepID=UPI0035694762
MGPLFEVLHIVRSLGINPLAVVIFAALACAFLEQRFARRRLPDFNAAYRNVPVYPNLPGRGRRRRKARSGQGPGPGGQ